MGLDCETECTTAEVRRAAILASQLPRESRVVARVAPEVSYGLEVKLLRQVEYNQRYWHWSNTKDAEQKVNQPEPLTLPGEVEAHERAVEQAYADALRVAEQFGITL